MERTRFLILSITLLLANLLAVAAQMNVSTDQSALLALKAHITSDPQNMIFTNWSTATQRHLRVAVLNLSYFGLTGTIPSELGNLSFLVELHLRNNSFHGTLPKELARLRRLKLISLVWNNFMGAIPSWFGSLFKLESFNLFGNRFSGPIPAAVFNLSSLQVLDLSYNQLSGRIPREIGNLTLLWVIYFDGNTFTEIPNEIGSLNKLEYLFVQEKALTCTIPVTSSTCFL
ncbi:receptor-like protein 35 [Rosa rugosa]|uniref:receptor-like protein 35 n=1 Tax=Rosa rugosa TaxID=74645 RepID=UPI002B40E3FD|nr:receptor-like protein 35 [Rosa rugosa]